MITMGCLGPENTFSHEATIKFAEKYTEFEIVFYKDFKGLIEAFKNKEVDEIVVPLANSTGKAVVNVLRELQSMKSFYGIQELYLQVAQCLIGYGKIEDIKIVYSHPQGIKQTIESLSKLNDICIKICDSTAGAVQFVSNNKNKSIAAIGSKLASTNYQVPIIREISDEEGSETRFLLLNNKKTKPTGNDKTTLFFRIADETGSLEKVVHIFTENKINMTMLSSMKKEEGANSRLFFVDADGHCDDENLAKALKEIEIMEGVDELVVLGSYPKAK
jgi:prephenate dehydratase